LVAGLARRSAATCDSVKIRGRFFATLPPLLPQLAEYALGPLRELG
jgi:hypothetical protein